MAKVGKRIDGRQEATPRRAAKPECRLDEAVKLVKANATAKFDETVEIAMNLGVDPRHADQMVRGVVTCRTARARRARRRLCPRRRRPTRPKAAGADVVGAEDLMETVQGGKVEFDVCIATPDMMPIVGRLGKILGPTGMMPNPKIGTVTPGRRPRPMQDAKGGQVQFRVEKAGVIHAGIGKASFEKPRSPKTPAPSSTRFESQAHGREGHLHEEGLADLDHGAGRDGGLFGGDGLRPFSSAICCG